MKGIRLLEKDFVNGVRLIRDKNYNPLCNGITRFSLQFFHHLVKEGVLNVNDVYRADFSYSKKHWYSLTLHTVDGYKFSFHGVSFGYSGEGSRGSAEILKACGFRNYKRPFMEDRNHYDKSDSYMMFKKIS